MIRPELRELLERFMEAANCTKDLSSVELRAAKLVSAALRNLDVPNYYRYRETEQ